MAVVLLAGVTAASADADLIGVTDYSDTFSIGAAAASAARQAYPPQAFPLPAGVEVIENSHGNPSVSWPPNA
ncbi:MAG: hypothetical protein IIA67_11025, partial [Planctomycetes bacterium]|nr:hypothetical protein [Planctomycetota bacterium]